MLEARQNPGLVLFGKAQRNILALLFGHPDQAFYLNEIVKFARTGVSQIQLELGKMTDAGLLLREKRAHQVYYRANPDSPIFDELKGIVTKTFGIAEVVRDALRLFAARIDAAFIYGSIAAATHTSKSDIDLFLIGDVRLSEIADALTEAEAKLGRTISPALYSRQEFVEKAAEKHHFITTVLERPKIFVIGNQGDLDALATGKPRES